MALTKVTSAVLANTAVSAGSYGTATLIPAITVDGQGRITAVSTNAVDVGANVVALGTDTTGNYIATITGTANEITVSGSGSETAGVTISLPATINANTTGSAATLTTARTIGGVSFDGSANIDLPGVNAAGNQNTTGSAATLTTARTIGGESFDGSANIAVTLAATATALATARTIGGVSFDGTANINLPGVNAAGNQNTSGTAATVTGAAQTAITSVGTLTSLAVGNITTTGYIRGPASFTIDPATHGDDTGTVVIAGNLQVDGTTTTINSTTVSIDDLNFSIATDAADSAAANGAGITIGGASATLLYTHATTSWDMNKPLNVTGALTSTTLQIGGTQVIDASRNMANMGNITGAWLYTGGINATSLVTTTISGQHYKLNTNGAGQNAYITYVDNGTNKWEHGKNTTDQFFFHSYALGGRVLTLANTGNAALGTWTPSAWHTDMRAIQLGAGGSGISGGATGNRNITLSNNAYLDASGDWVYAGTDHAANIEGYDGTWHFKVAASGTAGNDISFTEAMTIINSGNVGIGTTSPAELLTLKAGSTEETMLLFEDNSATDIGSIGIHPSNGFVIQQKVSGASVHVMTHDGNEDINLDADGFIQFEAAGAERMRIDSAGLITMRTSTSAVAAPHSAANELQIIGAGVESGITISNISDAGTGTLFFGDTSSSTAAGFRYNHNTGDMAISAEDNITIEADAVGIGTTSPAEFDDLADKLVIGSGSGSTGITIYTGNSSGDTGNIFFADGNTGSDRSRGRIRYDQNTDTMSFGTGAINDRLTLNSSALLISGKVGLGTETAPSGALHIKGASNSTSDLVLENTAGSAYFQIVPQYNADRLSIRNDAAAELFAITGTGLVGINEDTPTRDLHVKTAGSNNNGIVKVGGSDGTLGLEITYDQSGATSTTIVSNPTYTNVNSVMKLAVDGNANADQLVLMGNGKVGIGLDSPSGMLHIRTSTDHNLEIEETGGDLRISALNNNRQSNIELEFAASQFSFLTGNVGIGTTPTHKFHVVDGNNYALFGDTQSNSTMSLRMADSATYPVEVQAYSSELRFNTATTSGATPTVKMNILANGNVGIGTTAPRSALDVFLDGTTGETAHFGGGANVNSSGQYTGISLGYREASATTYTKVKIVSAGLGDGAARQDLHFLVDIANDGNSAVLADSKLKIDGLDGTVSTSGDFKPGADVIMESGRGISFTATGDGPSMSSELLDDYEEGTWTPVITASSGSITSYTINYAAYTKVGRVCHIHVYYTVTNNGTGSGVGRFTLPFTAQTVSSGTWMGSGREIGHTGKALIAEVNSNGTYAEVRFAPDGTYPTNGGYTKVTLSYIPA